MPNNLKQELSKSPNWENKNAYERTLLLCETFSAKGIPIPKISEVKLLIDRNNRRDIGKAIADFNDQMASQFKIFSKLNLGDMSPEFLAHSKATWDMAKQIACKKCEDSLTKAENYITTLEAENKRLLAELKKLKDQNNQK